jgi:hypothetical protein
MSASPVAVEHCRNCGVELPLSARFCPSCGAPVDAGETVEAVLPPHEPSPAPASFQQAEPRWFGVAPPQLLLALAVASFVAAIVLFATGHWPYGLILLGIGALLVAAFLEAARRRPADRLGRTSFDAKERARSSWETLRARQEAAAELRRIQSGLALLDSDRRGAFHDLGAAVHLHDTGAEAAARARLVELDRREAELREELERTHTEAGERIRRARLPVQETMMVLPNEPSPPPGEATPPQPAQVPEPYPPPDEGTPPQPARVPEPSPDPDPGRND